MNWKHRFYSCRHIRVYATHIQYEDRLDYAHVAFLDFSLSRSCSLSVHRHSSFHWWPTTNIKMPKKTRVSVN